MSQRPEFVVRTITAAGIATITLTCVIYAGWSYVAWLALIAVFGGYEFLRLIAQVRAHSHLRAMPAVLSLVTCFAGYVITAQRGVPWVMPALGTIMVLAISMTLVRPARPEQVLDKGRVWVNAFLYPFLPLAAGLMFTYPAYDYSYVLLPVILIWINDVMAYVIGRQWGRRKIAPHISPGKTVEGTLGAAVFTIIAGLFIATWFPDVPRRYALALGILVPFLALTGDLWESAVKRQAGVKDSGDLLPGHGGVLDRYDSFVFVLPVAALLYHIFAG